MGASHPLLANAIGYHLLIGRDWFCGHRLLGNSERFNSLLADIFCYASSVATRRVFYLQ